MELQFNTATKSRLLRKQNEVNRTQPASNAVLTEIFHACDNYRWLKCQNSFNICCGYSPHVVHASLWVPNIVDFIHKDNTIAPFTSYSSPNRLHLFLYRSQRINILINTNCLFGHCFTCEHSHATQLTGPVIFVVLCLVWTVLTSLASKRNVTCCIRCYEQRANKRKTWFWTLSRKCWFWFGIEWNWKLDRSTVAYPGIFWIFQHEMSAALLLFLVFISQKRIFMHPIRSCSCRSPRVQ